jgi:cysteine desulfurase/selenocysteine lyase
MTGPKPPDIQVTKPSVDAIGSNLVPGRFGAFDNRIWLNTAHQGPLPRAAVDACAVAAQLKAAPYRIADEMFTDVPEQLRHLLADLVGGRPDEVVLGNSTSHGLHLIANGLSWQAGDEVLLVRGDYPATLLPWLRLTSQGVTITWLDTGGATLSADELAAAITSRTRVLAVTWVNSFTGYACDVAALGKVCRAAGVLLVVNGSQGIGARPLNVANTPIDALVSCGYKWLCGPYGTGFSWLHPDLLARLRPQQAYWLAMHAGHGLDQMRETALRDGLGVRGFDVFCPAAFLNVLPWIAALELILEAGVEAIAEYDQGLVQQLVAGIDADRYRLVSPLAGPDRSTLIVLDRLDGKTASRYDRLTAAGVDIAYREGHLRICPHLFNTAAEISRALEVLHDDTEPHRD